jgi:type III pantothenate kinase
MKLLIDAGNTRIKWALADGEEWLCRGYLPTGQTDRLSRVIGERLAHLNPRANMKDINQIFVSNVAGEEVSRNILDIGAGISMQPHFVAARELQCDVSNGYSTVSQLGSDRWAALISAWHIVKGKCLVVNSGTATTIDTLSGRGEFIGGLILPGLEMMQHSLFDATDQLKSIQGEYVQFPLNTADAIFSGAIQAICGAIERQYNLLEDDSAPLILSGGTAVLLQAYLNQKLSKVSPRVVDDLVLRGLLLMAQEENCN